MVRKGPPTSAKGNPDRRPDRIVAGAVFGDDSYSSSERAGGLRKTGVTGSDRFAGGAWTVLQTGSPVFTSAVIAFDCRIIEVRSVASHNVFFGAVETVRVGPAGRALVYHDRAYKHV